MQYVPTTKAHSPANVSKVFKATENSALTTTSAQTTTTIAMKMQTATTRSAPTPANAKMAGMATVNPAQTKTSVQKIFAALETMNAKIKMVLMFVSASQGLFSMENHV